MIGTSGSGKTVAGGSTSSSIAQALEDARKMVCNIGKVRGGRPRRDRPAQGLRRHAEYELAQPLTADPSAVEAALNELSASGGGGPEAYSLAARR